MDVEHPSQRLRFATKRDASGDAPSLSTSEFEQLLVESREIVDELTCFVCRRHGLTSDDAEGFAAEVRFRLTEHDFEILRCFQHRSSLRTYLAVVVHRLFLDYRTRHATQP